MRGELHRRNAVRRRRREDVRRPGRQSRRVHRLGPGRRRKRRGRSRRTCRCGARRWRPPAELVFYGTMDGWFKALDARTGKLLWQFKAGSGIIGQPISYRGPDGRQYIAVVAGVGGWAGGDRRRPSSTRATRPRALGFANAVKDLPEQDHRGRHALCLHASALACSSSACRARAGACNREERHSRSKPLGETVPAGQSPDTIYPGGGAPPPLDPRAPSSTTTMPRRSPRASCSTRR